MNEEEFHFDQFIVLIIDYFIVCLNCWTSDMRSDGCR